MARYLGRSLWRYGLLCLILAARKGRQQMSGETTTIGRLGRVLYWTGILFGTLFAAFGAFAVWTPPDYRPALLLAAIGFAVPFLIGRAARYILAGE
jgi:drug/metabolite transporter (DMT)-like permease